MPAKYSRMIGPPTRVCVTGSMVGYAYAMEFFTAWYSGNASDVMWTHRGLAFASTRDIVSYLRYAEQIFKASYAMQEAVRSHDELRLVSASARDVSTARAALNALISFLRLRPSQNHGSTRPTMKRITMRAPPLTPLSTWLSTMRIPWQGSSLSR